MRYFLSGMLSGIALFFGLTDFATAEGTVPAALAISINGIGPAVNERVLNRVNRLIAEGIKHHLFDRFIIHGRGREGGFSGCVQLNASAAPERLELIERKLRAIHPNPATTAYTIERISVCEARIGETGGHQPPILPETEDEKTGEIGGFKLQTEPLPANGFRSDSAINDPRQVVIKDTQAWRQLWQDHYRNHSPVPELPVIDFSEKMILGVYLGLRANGGYSVRIESVEEIDNKLVVNYRESIFNGMTTQAITSPSDHVILDRSALPVEFRLLPVRHTCAE